MSEIEKIQVKQNIEMLIDRARYGSENFFTDSKSAAAEILNYLQQQNLINLSQDKMVN